MQFFKSNTFFLYINIIFDSKSDLVSELSFTDSPYLINVNNLVISKPDSLSIDTHDWESYEVIDLR